jgi:hypothetical protein
MRAVAKGNLVGARARDDRRARRCTGRASYPSPKSISTCGARKRSICRPTRCDKRLPQDDADFEAFLKKYEKYEIPYLQRRDDSIELNKVILHNDPVDHPTEPSAPQTNQPAERFNLPTPLARQHVCAVFAATSFAAGCVTMSSARSCAASSRPFRVNDRRPVAAT